jgi:glycosyltransferase involved in cell wall biosynthesis
VARKLTLHNPIVWVACPTACNVALKIKKSKLVYQRTDRFEEYPGVDAKTIATFDARLKANADLTVFVNGTLYNEEAHKCKRAVYLDHGVDFEMFSSAQQQSFIPADIANIGKPIVGFFGGIADHTFDISFMEKVIDLLPELSFVFVGKPNHQCCLLQQRKNVWILGQKPYERIPHYGKCFDVAIMPWKQNRWIEACNPIKLKEYLALGKPVVSTPFSELNKYLDVVYEANTPGDFARAIKKALTEDSLERIAARRNKIINASWDNKTQIILDELFTNNKKVIPVDECKE